MDQTVDVIIVGAGASGLTAGIQAARQGARVLILEHMDKAGKKILATGNGKCNFTNEKQGIAYYRGKNPAFVLPSLRQFGVPETLRFFRELGVHGKAKRDGYYYPASGQASSVLEVLLMECRRLGVTVECGVGIRSIQKKHGAFLFRAKQGLFQSKACILATGGKAAKKTGSDGSGFPYILGFGHHVAELVPALVQLQGKQPFLKEAAGTRAECNVILYIDGEKAAEDLGELQLTEFGVSGIPVFQVSRHASYGLLQGKQVSVRLDFLPGLPRQQAVQLLEERFFLYGEGKSAEEALIGLFPQKLNRVLLKESGIPLGKPAASCRKQELSRLAACAQQLLVDIVGTKGFDSAQVTAGGADTDEICPDTMESKLVPGLFFAGEVMDIDGMCGGYNLQWAWTSGSVAGMAAAAYAGHPRQAGTAGITAGKRAMHDKDTAVKATHPPYRGAIDRENCKNTGRKAPGSKRVQNQETVHRRPQKRQG